MARKKQIIVPIVILVTGVLMFAGFASMKKPPEEKPVVDNTPIVAVEEIVVAPMQLTVDSYGIVAPKYETELVAQISGAIVELSDEFVRGGFVKKGKLLARIDPNDYKAALIDAEANLASARAELEKERAQGKVAESEWKRITDTSPTELSLRKPQLAQELARVKAAQASVLRAERNLERTEIRAPYDAMIESREVGLGSFVGTGARIGKVLGTDTAEIRLPVADNQLEFLYAEGIGADVTLVGEYAGRTTKWAGKIARSEGVIDNKSRMSYLVAEFTDPYLLDTAREQGKSPLRFGSYVNADILGISLAEATVIPRYLVINDRVAILASDSTLRYVDIEIVRQQGADVVISHGLHQNDKLITSALDFPVDGMKLALATDEPEQENITNPDLENSENSNETAVAQVASTGE